MYIRKKIDNTSVERTSREGGGGGSGGSGESKKPKPKLMLLADEEKSRF